MPNAQASRRDRGATNQPHVRLLPKMSHELRTPLSRSLGMAQAAALRALREALSGAQKRAGASIKHDVAVPASEGAVHSRAAPRDVSAPVPAAMVTRCS